MQKGYIFQRGASWCVKYYETVLQDGRPMRKRVLKRLARVGDEYPTAQSVEHLAAEFLAPENSHARPESTETMAGFLGI